MEFSIDYNHSFNKNLWLTVRGNFTYATSKYTKYEEPAYEEDVYKRQLKGGSDMYNQTLNANPVLFPATFLPDNQPSHIQDVYKRQGTSVDERGIKKSGYLLPALYRK